MQHLIINPFEIEFPDRTISILLGFILLVLIIVRLAGPMISSFFKERTRTISDSYDKAEQVYNEAKQVRDEYADRLASIDREYRARLDVAQREAEEVSTRIMNEAKEAVEELRRKAEEEIARERAKQRILLRQKTVQLTLEAAENSFRDLNNDKAQRALIQNFVALAAQTQNRENA